MGSAVRSKTPMALAVLTLTGVLSEAVSSRGGLTLGHLLPVSGPPLPGLGRTTDGSFTLPPVPPPGQGGRRDAGKGHIFIMHQAFVLSPLLSDLILFMCLRHWSHSERPERASNQVTQSGKPRDRPVTPSDDSSAAAVLRRRERPRRRLLPILPAAFSP